jgi:hypothetical protein
MHVAVSDRQGRTTNEYNRVQEQNRGRNLSYIISIWSWDDRQRNGTSAVSQ